MRQKPPVRMKKLSYCVALCILLTVQVATAQKVFNLHSHNDYEQKVPFWTAFGVNKPTGIISIEADVILRNDTLFVAHDAKGMAAERTLTTLYLEPLQQVMTTNFYKNVDIQLLIDVKILGEKSLEVIIAEIKKYPALIDAKQPGKKLRFVISGSRPIPEKYGDYPDYIYFDHQDVTNLNKIDLKKVALVSLPFYSYSKWNGRDTMAVAEVEVIKNLIEKVHATGKPIRFWATPDTQTAWKFFRDLGVDFINTDSPFSCNDYLNSLQE